ncbi:dromaiocalcin-1-like [Brachyistius frenatus]|uniref:dromaiocalcin-1-like n=1 Tax=Brachyistius frenatus TaxID=100188 RepID=UPI0037E9223A
MTWEQALTYCGKNLTTLTSLTSETEQRLAMTKIQRHDITYPVWLGLRFLGDRWLWVNGDPLEYEAWPQGGDQDHQCPMWRRCGALTKEGLWENVDCGKKLSFICD